MKRVFAVVCLVVFTACVIACGGSGGTKAPISATNARVAGGGSGGTKAPISATNATVAGEDAPQETAEGRARAKWKIIIASWQADHDEVSDRKIKQCEAELARAKKDPPEPALAKRIRSYEDTLKRAQEAVDAANKDGNALKIKETTRYLGITKEALAEAREAVYSRAERDLATAIVARAKPVDEPWVAPDAIRVGDVTKLGVGSGKVPVFEVFQIVSRSSALIKYGDYLFWGEFNTNGLADKDYVRLDGLVECTGTRQYTTALGTTNTVRILHEYR